MASDWLALQFMGHRIRERARDRARRGLPPEPPLSSEQVLKNAVDAHCRPSAFAAYFAPAKSPSPMENG